jgi:hypothetical protein
MRLDKGAKLMTVVDCRGLPVAVPVDSAMPHEVTAVEAVLVARCIAGLLEWVSARRRGTYERDARHALRSRC